MPTYDYICSKCEHTFDKILRIDDRAAPTNEACPSCGQIGCVSISFGAPSLMSPFRVDGLKKPSGQFRERVQQIKKGLGRTKTTLKDY
jgi:putative FmdB family regulatory protein